MSDWILLYGDDQLLLHTRTMVLERAGLAVLTAIEASDVERIVLSQKISLLVLCHTLSSEKCEAAVSLAESIRPAIRSLVLTAGMPPCSERAHDTILSSFAGPRSLVDTVERLLHTVPAAI